MAKIIEFKSATDKYLIEFDEFLNDDGYIKLTAINAEKDSLDKLNSILQADINALTRQAKAIFPREMVIAKRNYCFSMQDCIDGIIPLMFSEIDENTLLLDDKPFFLKFGTPFDEVEEKLKSIGISFFDIEEVEKGDDSAIDNLINSIDEGDGEEEDDDNFDDDHF